MRSLLPLLVEPTMYAVLGFLLAALCSLPFMGIVHRRAERLTRQQLDSLLPMSIKELHADRDLLRAEFAVSAQRSDSTVHELKAKAAAQQIEIGRHGGTVATLKAELGQKASTIRAIEARETALKQQLRATEQEHSRKSIALEDARRALMNKEAELARLAADLDTRTVVADQQNVELAGTRADVEALKAKVEDHNREVETLKARLGRHRDEMEAASRQLADERGKVENLGRRIADLESELTAQRNEAEALSKVTADRFGEQARVLAAREYEADRLLIALEGARRAEASLRSELAELEERRVAESKVALADKTSLEMEVARLQLDRQQLQWELATLRRDAEKSQAADRVESAMMRKRIGEISEQVAQLRGVLELQASAPRPTAPESDIRVAVNAFDDATGLNGYANGHVNGQLNGQATSPVNGHAATVESPFAALDKLCALDLRVGTATTAPEGPTGRPVEREATARGNDQVNGHAATVESPFTALDKIFAHELHVCEATAAPQTAAN